MQPADGLAAAARAGVHHAGQRQGRRGQAAPGPGRPVPVHRRAGEGAPGRRAAGDQRGRQEEGAGRGVRAGRAGVAAEGRPGAGPRPLLPGQGRRARDPVRDLRRGREHRVRQRGHRRQHRGAGGGVHPPLVGSWRGRTPTRARRGCWSPATPAGSNGWRNRAWKAGLAELAQETGLEITVCHFPPGTSKWNKIEHRLFSQITLAWRGRPLTSYDVIINTIGAVTTSDRADRHRRPGRATPTPPGPRSATSR